MNWSIQLATHWRAVFTGGNWTSVNLRATLQDVTLEEARTQVRGLNTIAALTYHLHYYTVGVREAFRDRPLVIRDKYAWDLPDLEREADWEQLRNDLLSDAEGLATDIAGFPEDRWADAFTDPKYGTFAANVLGLIEHAHYHLGQIVVVKKSLRV